MKPVISFFKTVENSVNIPLRSRLSLSSMLTSFNACGFPNDVEKAKQFWLEKLCQKNVPEAELSIDHFLAHILGLQSITSLSKPCIRNRKLNQEECAALQRSANLRLKRMPVQYIIGEWDFMGLTLEMAYSPPVFIPRTATEDLVFMASSLVRERHMATCFEVGCGSGAISLALLRRNSGLKCYGVDADVAAVNLATRNCENLKLAERASFWTAQLTENGLDRDLPLDLTNAFDMVVSNPPYIPTSEIDTLAPEITLYEPRLALDGGPEGTTVIEMILRHAPRWIRSGGILIMEIDPRQFFDVEKLAKATGCYSGSPAMKGDCSGVDRFIILTKK